MRSGRAGSAGRRSSASGCSTPIRWPPPDFDPEDAVAFWDLTNRQDWHVCEQMQLGLGSRAYQPGPYSHREELLPQFDRIILELERTAQGGGTG